MEKLYMDNRLEIFKLIMKKDDETLYNKYPDIKKYRRFLDFMINALKEEYGGESLSQAEWFANAYMEMFFEMCDTNIQEDIIVNEAELIRAVNEKSKFSHLKEKLLIFFNPTIFSNTPGHMAYYLGHMISDEYDANIVKNDYIRNLLLVMKDIKDNHPDFTHDASTLLLLTYAYINNNYEYLEIFLSNPEFYDDRIVTLGYAETGYGYGMNSDAGKKIYNDIPKIFVKTEIAIK